ncbi:MAG: hypothetical protein ACJA08_002134 [Cyclobacteriaceae bacterium]|jgi:hypothetical protein
MDDFLVECFTEAFSDKNLNSYWINRNSDKDLFVVSTELPISNQLNEVGTRNIEIWITTQYGIFSKTLALIENGDIIIPNEFKSLAKDVNFGKFKRYSFKREIDIMIGAFSLQTLFNATKQEDIDLYEANGIQYELIKSFDGTMQCFPKEKVGLEAFSPLTMIEQSELEGKPISAFKFDENGTGIFPTTYTHTWLDSLKPQRLMEIFTRV